MYEFVKLPPAVHAPTMLMLGFPTMGVPAIKVGDVRVSGTRWIARALDELYPDRPLLFPPDPAERRKVQDAERWGERLQNAVRRIFYCAARRDRETFLSVPGRPARVDERAARRRGERTLPPGDDAVQRFATTR